jgi:hypothetical protein
MNNRGHFVKTLVFGGEEQGGGDVGNAAEQ